MREVKLSHQTINAACQHVSWCFSLSPCHTRTMTSLLLLRVQGGGKKDFSNGTATFEGICLVSWRCLYQIKGFKMLLWGGERRPAIQEV